MNNNSDTFSNDISNYPKININSIDKHPTILKQNYINTISQKSIMPIIKENKPLNTLRISTTKPTIEFINNIPDSYSIHINPSPETSSESYSEYVPEIDEKCINTPCSDNESYNCFQFIEKCIINGISYTQSVFYDIFNINPKYKL